MSNIVLEEIDRRANQIQLIVMEFHDTISSRQEFLEFAGSISKVVPIVHIHGNNFGQIGQDGFPEVVEITFAARKYISDKKTSEFPHYLDSPCNPTKSDISFSFKIWSYVKLSDKRSFKSPLFVTCLRRWRCFFQQKHSTLAGPSVVS